MAQRIQRVLRRDPGTLTSRISRAAQAFAAWNQAFPSIRGPRVPLTGIPGSPPDLAEPPEGCRFAPRCPKAMAACATTQPDLYQVDGVAVRCLLHANGKDASD